MNKLSIGKDLLNFKQNIKNDAMRPTICIMVSVLLFMSFLIMVINDRIIQYYCLFIVTISIGYAIYINNYFAKHDPDRLQTEKFLIHKQLIENGMLENRQGNILDNNVNNTLPPNSRICLTDNTEEVQEVEK